MGTPSCWAGKLGEVSFASARVKETDGLREMLSRTRRGYSDGSGGDDSQPPSSRKAASGVATFEWLGDGSIRAEGLVAEVLGRQTVPRAEVWGAALLLERAPTSGPFRIVLDAACVRNGLESRGALLRSVNGDLWSILFAMTERRDGPIDVVKVKSHVINGGPAALCSGGHNADDVVGNELADAAAETGHAAFTYSATEARGVKEAEARTFNVAVRLGRTQARIWEQMAGAAVYQPPEAPVLDEELLDRRKVFKDIAQSTVTNGHVLFREKQGLRCQRCQLYKGWASREHWCRYKCRPRRTAEQQIKRLRAAGARGTMSSASGSTAPATPASRGTKRLRAATAEPLEEQQPSTPPSPSAAASPPSAGADPREQAQRRHHQPQQHQATASCPPPQDALPADAGPINSRPQAAIVGFDDPCVDDVAFDDGPAPHVHVHTCVFDQPFNSQPQEAELLPPSVSLETGELDTAVSPKADAHCLPSGSVGGESIVRRRLNKKTKPADAYSQAGPAMEPASCDSPAAQEGLVTREAAAATRRKFREEATAHERKARATRTEAWKAAFHEPAAVHLHADHVQTEFIADECVQWAVHASHTVRKSPGAEILFCEACGAWSRGLKTRGLAVACRKTSAHRGNIRLLQLGIAPVKGARVPNALKKAGSRGTRGGSAAKSGKRRAKRRA